MWPIEKSSWNKFPVNSLQAIVEARLLCVTIGMHTPGRGRSPSRHHSLVRNFSSRSVEIILAAWALSASPGPRIFACPGTEYCESESKNPRRSFLTSSRTETLGSG